MSFFHLLTPPPQKKKKKKKKKNLILSLFFPGVSCPDGWLYNPHHATCVKAFSSQVNWLEARDACSALRSTLLHVDSDAMNAFVVGDITATGVLS